jgi:hypothetical protein
MRIGVDFDNTIVCYDQLFHRVAVKKGLIPRSVPETKGSVRDYLRLVNQEGAWTAMQGEVYGARMNDAEPFPGVLEFFTQMVAAGHTLFIISHKTATPYLGPKYDLHQAARGWLESRGFFTTIGLPPEHVFFDLTKEDKLKRIARMQCNYFVDDLPEFLAEAAFPKNVQQLLFDPADAHPEDCRYQRMRSWQEITGFCLLHRFRMSA